MKRHHLYALIVFCLSVFYGAAVAAQAGNPSLFTEQDVAEVPDWDAVASSAETALSGPAPSQFRLNRLRDELVTWRDTFVDAADINAGRIATVQDQIAALGPEPESGEEPEEIASRRSKLNAQLAELQAPSILAQESYARANGLISEVDFLMRGRDASALTERTGSPLNPSAWPDAVRTIGRAGKALIAETTSRTMADFRSGKLAANLPYTLIFFAIAGVLLLRGRDWVLGLQGRIDDSTAQGRAVWSFLVSVWQVILPLLGLVALRIGIDRLDNLGRGGQLVLDAILGGAFIVVLARWISAQFFPKTDASGPMRVDKDTRGRARRFAMILAWLLALGLVLVAVMNVAEPEPISIRVMVFPLQVLLGISLFQFGRLLRRDPMVPADLPPDTLPPKGRVRKLVGTFCSVIAVATPVLAALGFSAAATAIFMPAVLTLAVLAIVLLLQRFVNDLWDMRTGNDVQEAGPLAPVLIGFVLFLIALPVLALVWGARVVDLFEVWARFRSGFAIGETRISPADFIMFAAVFAGGYLLTRFIQSTLRTTVLPRTRLDLGGQNAVIAGFGYVGIGLAAIIAVTMAGIDLSNLAIVAGALSVGIGFGLQNIVSNFVSGIILLIERPIGEGDWIEVNGTMGYVRDISVRSTRIETFDRTDVIIPNADLVSGQVTNWTRGNAVGRVIVPVGVAYGTDTKQVMDILEEVAKANPMVLLNPPPNVLFLEFGDNSLNFEIRAILRDVNFVMVVKSEMNLEIEKRFAEVGIEIPFPQRDLWIKNPEDLRGDPAT